jgi:hypothetical protein
MPIVSSSAIYRVEYDEASRRLDIWFTGTGQYSYFGVPLATYLGLLRAPSKGRYFNDNIRDQYG